MFDQGASQPAPVSVGLGRSNVVVTLAVFAFLCWVVWAGAHGAYVAKETSARVIGYGVAAIFAVPLLMLLRAAPRFLAPRRLIFGPTGLTITHGSRQVSLKWADVMSIGISFEQVPEEHHKLPTSPDELKDLVKDVAVDKVSDVLQISDKRRLVLEIFPVTPQLADGVPELKPYWKAEPPAEPGMPPFAWRFPLPPVVSIAGQAAQGAQAFAPQVWRGWRGKQSNG